MSEGKKSNCIYGCSICFYPVSVLVLCIIYQCNPLSFRADKRFYTYSEYTCLGKLEKPCDRNTADLVRNV